MFVHSLDFSYMCINWTDGFLSARGTAEPNPPATRPMWIINCILKSSARSRCLVEHLEKSGQSDKVCVWVCIDGPLKEGNCIEYGRIAIRSTVRPSVRPLIMNPTAFHQTDDP